MGQLVFQATSGGQVNLVGPNTASTFNLNVPAVSSTLATLTGTETFTNKTLTSPTLTTPVLGTPASGTLTNCTGLPNAGLTNSSVTVGSTSIALGATATTIAGLTSLATNTLTSASATALTLQSAGTTAITVDTSQNVGVGTASPSQKLQVLATNSTGFAGAAIQNQNTNVGIAGVQFSSDTTYFKSAIGQVRSDSNGVGSLVFYNASSTGAANWATSDERMRIDSSGNVGIGTTSPSTYGKLTVNDTAAKSVYVRSSSTNFSGLLLENTNSATKWQIGVEGGAFNTAGLLNIGIDGVGSKMAINSSGIVTMGAYGAGAATFSSSGVISSVSDETWKIKDGVPVDVDSMLNKLEPGYWYYNEEKKETFGTDRQLGFYAQNVNAAIGPEAAPVPEEGKPWGYYDRSVLAVTVMSLQKALATIESLTTRIAALEVK